MAQEPKSQTQDAASPQKEGKSTPPQGKSRPPRDGKNKRGGKGRPGGGRPGGGRDRGSSSGPLTTGLFSGMADKQLPCKIKGCKETFLWTAQQQLRSFGKPPPSRMCETHASQLYDLSDKVLPCRNAPACDKTWVWKRGAQLHARQRQQGEGELKTPSRLCESCYGKEKELKDQEIECRTQGCARTWVWTRDAQIRHRAWLRREMAKIAKEEEASKNDGKVAEAQPNEDASAAVEVAAPEVAAAAAPELEDTADTASDGAAAEATSEAKPEEKTKKAKEGGKSRKRRKKPRRLQEGPPERHCKTCAERFTRLEPIELPCKVHGCKSTWVWDRVSQLKAWVALGTEDTQAPVKPVKRMCPSCRDFCKKAKERDVPCAKDGCNKTWRFKVGAQLQHVLSTGGVQDPRRLCESCVQEQYQKSKSAGGELMPCAKPGCDGTWFYVNGMTLAPFEGTEIPPDRLCNPCRTEQGLPARPMSAEPKDLQTGDTQAPSPESVEIPAEKQTATSDQPQSEPSPHDPQSEPSPNDLQSDPSPDDPQSEPNDPQSEPSPNELKSEASPNDPQSELSPDDPKSE